MVDFNNEATVGTPAVDIVRVLILQRQNDVIESIEHINKLGDLIQEEDLSIVRARMFSLYLQFSGTLKRHLKTEELKELKEVIRSGNKEKILDQLEILNDVLDKIKLTRIDTKKVYDSTIAETENEEKNL